MKKKRRSFRIPLCGRNAVAGIVLVCACAFNSCRNEPEYYGPEDFGRVRKIDVHFHYLTFDTRFMEFAETWNFRLLSPNWDGEGISIDDQCRYSEYIHMKYSGSYAFFGTFPAEGFHREDFMERTLSGIRKCIDGGASGIKIWKNIGMVLQNQDGTFVMVDDPLFAPVFDYLEEHRIPVMGHLGEPRDCWLPESEMTDPSDVNYYRGHPEYYMFLHPEVPSYDQQIRARDHLLEMHPGLDFIGAHLGSLEWNVDEIAGRLERYPNLKVDISGRMYHLQYQSERDRDRVRNFMIKYQDRILYGTDIELVDPNGQDPEEVEAAMLRTWKSHWIYLATDSSLRVKGLQLPKGVIDKIYYRNAESYFR